MEVMTFNIGKDRRNLVDDKQNFNIDFHDSKYNWLEARQYEENMRQVEVHVVHGDGSPVDLTGMNPVFEGWLPEGVYRIIDAKHAVMIDAQNGIFRFDFPAPAFQIAGSYKQAFFRLMKDGKSVTTLEFSLDVMADKVISGLVPSDYITPFEDLYNNLKSYITNANGDFDTAMTQWKKDVADLVTNLNADVGGINLTITEIKTQLSALEDKIKADGLLTQADLDAALIDIRSEIKKGIDQITELNNHKFSINTAYQSSDNVDPIFKDEVDRVLSKIDENKFNLVVNTDAHYQERTTYGRFMNWPGISQKSMRHYSNLTALGQKADVVIAGGDNMHPDYLNIEVGKKDMEIVANKVLDNPTKGDRFMVLGNHDVGDSVTLFNGTGKFKLEDVITEKEVKQYYRTADSEFGEVRNGDSLYFYKDYPDKNIRLICLVTEDTQELLGADGYVKYTRMDNHVFSQEQLNWVANVALMTTPKDYHVVMYGHAPLLENNYDGKLQINSNELADIINAWINGQSRSIISDPRNVDYPVNINVDYSGRGTGIFVGYFCGHNHKEAMRDFYGIKIINLMHSICEKGYSNVDRHPDTVSEDAQTVVSVDTNKRVVNLIGFGAATDRNFEY